MAADINFFTRSGARNVADFVRRMERRPTNNIQPWRANKYTLGQPGMIKWGLSKPSINPSDPMDGFALRIENGPTDEISYYSPDGTYGSPISFPLNVLADTWYPMMNMDGIFHLMCFDSYLFGVLGNITGHNPGASPPTQPVLTIDDGIGEGREVLALSPSDQGRFQRPANDILAYAVRLSNYSPGGNRGDLFPDRSFATIIAQPCEESE